VLYWLNCICCDIFQCSKFFHHHIDLHIITFTCILSVPNRWNIKDYVLWALSTTYVTQCCIIIFQKNLQPPFHENFKTGTWDEMYSVLCQDGKTTCNIQIVDSGFMCVISVTFTGTFFTVTNKTNCFRNYLVVSPEGKSIGAWNIVFVLNNGDNGKSSCECCWYYSWKQQWTYSG